MPIPDNNTDLYCDKCQSMINPKWSVAINRAHNRACSLRGNALVAQQGLFILLFTLAVKSEHHPEMLESLITGSTFLAKKEKDHVDRDHLWNRNLVELCSLPFKVWLRKCAEWPQSSSCMGSGVSQNFPGYTEHSCSNMFVQKLFFPSETLLLKLDNSSRNLIVLKETFSQSPFSPGQTVWSQS